MSKNHNLFPKGTYNKIISEENIYRAFKRINKSNGKYNVDLVNFELDLYKNIEILSTRLKHEIYVPGKYTEFKVYEPKERLIAAPSFIDKLIQFSIHNIINDKFENKFIIDSFACQDNKGTHKCANKIQHYMRKSRWKSNNKVWILKGDVKSYFDSINHDILKELLSKEIKCKKTLKLLFKIIDKWNKSGLPLGNITSQLFANIYLNQLDIFCKRKLSLKYYVRYMDDFFIAVDDKYRLKNYLEKIKEFVFNKLKLKLNKNKTKIFPIDQGINIVGYKIHTTHKLLRNKSKKDIKRKLGKFKNLYNNNKIRSYKIEQILNSWKGHANYASSFNFYIKLIKKFDYLYLRKNKFKINKRVINS